MFVHKIININFVSNINVYTHIFSNEYAIVYWMLLTSTLDSNTTATAK